MKEIDTMDMRTRAWLFIAYEMYVCNRSKQELDNMESFQLIVELNEFDRWLKSEPGFPMYYIKE